MEEDTLNLIRNSILNDHCKMFCIPAMEENKKSMKIYYRKKVFMYCVIYELEYFIKSLFEIHKKDNVKNEDDIEFAYLYYLQEHNKNDDGLKNRLVDKYRKKTKKLQKYINDLTEIKFDVALIKHSFKEKLGKDLKNNNIMSDRIDIINTCMRYKILSKELNLIYNEKIDKILKRNIMLVKKCNSIEDKFYLM